MKVEKMVFILSIISYVIITIFHEPWFDEAQAWQIARYCSIKDLLFVVGHYEGHPFLWYFILALPSKIGIPFEVGLKTVGFLIFSFSVWFFLYKSSFPKVLRCLIPFFYYFFYQYGIIVRQYGLMLLLLMVCAFCFNKKDCHPWYFVIPMIFLCSLSAYGIVLSGGISLCWVADIIKENKVNSNFKKLFHDPRFVPLFTLLLYALSMIACIMPVNETYSPASLGTNNHPLVCFLVALLTFVGDAFMTTSPFFSIDTMLLQNADIDFAFVVAAGLVSIVLAGMFICFSSREKLKYLIIPTILFYVFSSCVYFTAHHLGILASYYLFWCWITWEDNKRFEIGNYLFKELRGTDENRRKLKIVGIGILCFCAIVNIYWTISACILDLRYEYSCGRETAIFLKETGLNQLKVASVWIEYPIQQDEIRGPENINTVLNGTMTLILSYFDHNFIYTFNGGEDIGYTRHKNMDPVENAQNIEKAKQQGIPDVLIGEVNLTLLTDDAVTMQDYVPVYQMNMNQIFKADYISGTDYIYIRRDLLDQYALEEVEKIDTSFIITEEVKERFENGESMESILEPFFDQMFGD